MLVHTDYFWTCLLHAEVTKEPYHTYPLALQVLTVGYYSCMIVRVSVPLQE
jgi:hypothetical protein